MTHPDTTHPTAAPDPPTPDQIPAMLTAVMTQIRFARRYTHTLLDATPQDRWFDIPSGFPSNVAWQIGHLTVGQYGLLLFRIRGRTPDDLDLIPGRFRKAYGKGSVPTSDPSRQPSADELAGRLDRVLAIAEDVIPTIDAATLAEPCDDPVAGYPTKLGAVMFAPLHEHIHAGQIGMIRRGLGLDPVR